MAIDQMLLDILVCPNCKGKIEYREAEQKIYCVGDCRYIYPVRDDIPIMLIEEATKP